MTRTILLGDLIVINLNVNRNKVRKDYLQQIENGYYWAIQLSEEAFMNLILRSVLQYAGESFTGWRLVDDDN